MSKKMNSIKIKIIMFLIPMLLISFIILSGLGYKFASDSLKESNLNIMEEMTKTAAGRADDQIKSEIKNLEVIASNPIIRDESIQLQEKIEILKPALKTIDQVQLSISDKDGNSIDTLGNVKKIKTTQSFMKSIKGENSITNPYLDPNTNSKVIAYSVPIKDSKDNIIGIITSVKDCMDFSVLNKEINFLKTGSALIVDSNGNFIVADDESFVRENKNITNMTSDKGPLDDLNNIGKSMIIGEQSGIGKYTYENKSKYIAYSPIGKTGLSMGISVEEKDLLSALTSLALVDTIVTIVMLVLLVSVIVWFTIKIINRLLGAKNYVDSIARGDFYTQIDNKYIKGNDEISEICTSVAKAKISVGSIIKAVRNNANVVKDDSLSLNKIATDLSVLTEEISASIGEVSGNTNRQSLDFKDISNKLTNFSGEVNVAKDNVHLISKDVSVISDKSLKGNKDIEELNQGIISVNESFEKFAMSIDYIHGDMKNVDEITNIINGISEQINLLSLNAAIEAASAGDAGRGFNVIASEIRRLSDKSKESAQNIYNIINRLMKIINKLVDESQNMDSELEKQKVIVNKASASFSEIAELVTDIAPKVLNIEDVFENISQDQELILGNVYELSEDVKNTSESLEQIGFSALEIADLGENLNNSSDLLLSKSDELIEKVKQFKIEKDDFEIKFVVDEKLVEEKSIETKQSLENENTAVQEDRLNLDSRFEELSDFNDLLAENFIDTNIESLEDTELDVPEKDVGWEGSNITGIKEYIKLKEKHEYEEFNDVDESYILS